MSTRTSVICDECGAVKGEQNHWFSAVYYDEPLFMKYEAATVRFTYKDYPSRLDYCGQECASKGFHRWLDTGSILREAQEETR